MSAPRLLAHYRIACPAHAIEARAQALALEQSVELPLEAVRDERVRREIVGEVKSIEPAGSGGFDVTLALAEETVGDDPGQLMNMLFGNCSLQPDVELVDVELPPDLAAAFGGPRFGVAGVRALLEAPQRPLTCAALKPQGLTASALAALAGTFARAGIDIIKDDHGLADQRSAPFAERVAAVQQAIDAANRTTGHHALYAPSLTGSPEAIETKVRLAREHGVRMLMLAPMISGVSTLGQLARLAGLPILAHPALAGLGRIAPPLLLGKLFRLFGADATIYPHHGGRFGYTPGTCAEIAHYARTPWHGLRPALPVPAGGMTLERIPELRRDYGDDVVLLVGGNLLASSEPLEHRCRAFVAAARGDESTTRETRPRTSNPTPT